MAARYQVPVNDAALAAQPWVAVPGLRMVRKDGRWDANPALLLCTFEDDSAGPEYEGRVVDLQLRVDAQAQAGPPVVRLVSRQVIS